MKRLKILLTMSKINYYFYYKNLQQTDKYYQITSENCLKRYISFERKDFSTKSTEIEVFAVLLLRLQKSMKTFKILLTMSKTNYYFYYKNLQQTDKYYQVTSENCLKRFS